MDFIQMGQIGNLRLDFVNVVINKRSFNKDGEKAYVCIISWRVSISSNEHCAVTKSYFGTVGGRTFIFTLYVV
jgi:hypothetical protein